MERNPEISEASKEASIVQERLNWKLACRDDAKVAQGLDAGEEIEELHELSEAGLLDECFVFLEEIGMCSPMRKRADQTRGCPAQNEKEARTDQCPVPGR